jgi:hypothetical protein
MKKCYIASIIAYPNFEFPLLYLALKDAPIAIFDFIRYTDVSEVLCSAAMSFKDIAPLFIAARILRFVPQGNLTP